jgi:hypothetical protein
MKKSWRPVALALAAGVAILAGGRENRAEAVELVLFEANWCPVCREWNRSVAPGYAANPLGNKAPLRRVQLGTPRPPELAKPHVGTIYGVPTFVVMDKGREIGRIEGYPGEKRFWKRLGAILGETGAPLQPERVKPLLTGD